MIYVFYKTNYYKIQKVINGKWMLKFNSNALWLQYKALVKIYCYMKALCIVKNYIS